MAAYLRHKEDGRIYIYTELLAKDPNLEPYNPEPAPEPAVEKSAVKRAKKETPAQPLDDIQVEV